MSALRRLVENYQRRRDWRLVNRLAEQQFMAVSQLPRNFQTDIGWPAAFEYKRARLHCPSGHRE